MVRLGGIGIGLALGLYESAFATLAGIYGRNARRSISGITLLAGFASSGGSQSAVAVRHQRAPTVADKA